MAWRKGNARRVEGKGLHEEVDEAIIEEKEIHREARIERRIDLQYNVECIRIPFSLLKVCFDLMYNKVD
jgi:hypothetical protein